MNSAREQFAQFGVDADLAISKLRSVPVSIHCWQGDDVQGFESGAGAPGGGLAVTGNFPGRARNLEELQQDLSKAISLIPGKNRLNLHAIYGDFGGQKVERNAIELRHFQTWIDWCRTQNMGLDFNPTCFAHPMAAQGATLSHPDASIREFWIEHCKRCREIAVGFSRELGTHCVHNIWIPDGSKDLPVDRQRPRQLLRESLDTIFQDRYSGVIDAVESKLFGIGSESYVAGSHEFYLGYAISNHTALCLDAGHFHPTENLSDKLSSVLQFIDQILLHVSRGIRWDSDHVVIQDDQTCQLMQEIAALEAFDRVHIGLDYFDASINRIAAWVIGTRATQKAILRGLLMPWKLLRDAEAEGDYTTRLALFENAKTLPWQEVWNAFCDSQGVPSDQNWMSEIKTYESQVLSKRLS
jgi:L-rhamnose isomerase